MKMLPTVRFHTSVLVSFAFLSAVLLAPLALGQEADLDSRLAQLRRSAPAEIEPEVTAFLAGNPDRNQVLTRLRAGVLPSPEPSLVTGWSVREAPAIAGSQTHPYQLYLSESARNATQPLRLLVHLHGAVARPEYSRSPGDVGYGRILWVAPADEQGFVLVCPLGKAGAEWWKPTGVAAVEAVVRDVKRLLPVHDDRVVVTGFSDGASGSFHLAMTAPDRFAAFVPMNGQPMVPGLASGRRLHPRNMAHTPMFVLGTRDDSLYPMHAVLPHFEPALKAGGQLRVLSWEGGDHQPAYFENQRSSIVDYITTAERVRNRDRVQWRFDQPSRIDPIELLEMGGESADGFQVMRTSGRVVLGVTLNANVTDAAEIETVTASSLAEKLGVLAGDRVVQLDEAPIGDRFSLSMALRAKEHGKPIQLRVERGGETIQLGGVLPAFKPEPIYRRDVPGAEIDYRVGVSLDTVGVRRLAIDWDRPGSPPASLRVNGQPVELQWTERSLREILLDYARVGDARAIRTHRTVLQIP